MRRKMRNGMDIGDNGRLSKLIHLRKKLPIPVKPTRTPLVLVPPLTACRLKMALVRKK